MRRRFLLLLPVLLLPVLAAAPVPVRAEPATADAAEFVRRTGVELGAVVAGASSPQDREARLAQFLDRVVDIDGVARFCLGRFWAAATPPQRSEYLRLFRLVLLKGVINRLGDYQAGSVKVTVNPAAERTDGISVPTVVERPGNKPVSIVWLLTPGPDMRIADLAAEGMSLRITQRSDYAAFLARNGGDVGALIAAMRARVGE